MIFVKKTPANRAGQDRRHSTYITIAQCLNSGCLLKQTSWAYKKEKELKKENSKNVQKGWLV